MRMFRCRLVAKRNDVLGVSSVTVFFRFQVRRRRADAMSAVCVCAIEWGPNRTTYPDDTSTDVVIRPRGERERERDKVSPSFGGASVRSRRIYRLTPDGDQGDPS